MKNKFTASLTGFHFSQNIACASSLMTIYAFPVCMQGRTVDGLYALSPTSWFIEWTEIYLRENWNNWLYITLFYNFSMLYPTICYYSNIQCFRTCFKTKQAPKRSFHINFSQNWSCICTKFLEISIDLKPLPNSFLLLLLILHMLTSISK